MDVLVISMELMSLEYHLLVANPLGTHAFHTLFTQVRGDLGHG